MLQELCLFIYVTKVDLLISIIQLNSYWVKFDYFNRIDQQHSIGSLCHGFTLIIHVEIKFDKHYIKSVYHCIMLYVWSTSTLVSYDVKSTLNKIINQSIFWKINTSIKQHKKQHINQHFQSMSFSISQYDNQSVHQCFQSLNVFHKSVN